MPTQPSTARLTLLALIPLLVTATTSSAFNGPYTTFVNVAPGVDLELDVRWPDTGSPPLAGWPVLFFAHGAGGSKNSNTRLASDYADQGYLTLTYTNRPEGDRNPTDLGNDLVALKSWLVNDFESDAGVSAPTDANAFGMTGNSLGGLTTWSGVLLTDTFAAAVPFNWGYHMFVDYIESQGSLERQTGGDIAVGVGGEYPSGLVDAVLEAAFAPVMANFPLVTIPVQNQIAMLDARVPGTHALSDHLALTAASQRMIYLGTGGHGTPNNDSVFRDDLRLRWFNYHLKGESNGIETEDPIRMALLGTNEHVSYPSWPPPGQTTDTLYLGPQRSLNQEIPLEVGGFDRFDNDPGQLTWASAQPTFSVATIRSEIVRDVIQYDSGALLEETLMVGAPSVTLHVAGTGSRYQVNVHLLDVSPNGTAVLLAVGTATPDTSPTELTIPLTITGRRIPAGHRLRLEITNRDDQDVDPTNGYTPEFGKIRFLPFFEFSANTVFYDAIRPSSVTLPLLGSAELVIGPAVPALSPFGLMSVVVGLASSGIWLLRKRPHRRTRSA